MHLVGHLRSFSPAFALLYAAFSEEEKTQRADLETLEIVVARL